MSCEKKIKVILHGYLKDLYPHDIYMTGDSVAEIVNGVCRQTKAFNIAPDQERHCISVVGFPTENSLRSPIPANVDELHLVPELGGGKSGGFFRILIGVVLIAASFIPGVQVLTLGALGSLSGMMLNFGISLVLGGLIEMLSPSPKIDRNGDTASDPEASKYLGASANTVKIGTRIPLLYGEHMAFGHYLSFDVDAVDVAL